MAGTVKDFGPFVLYQDKDIRFAGTGGIEIPDGPQLLDDFLGDTLHADFWATNVSAGATAFAVNVQREGVIRGATGATDDEKSEIAGEIIWLPSQGLVFEARVKISAITTVAVNVGLSDAKSEGASLIATTLSGITLTTTASNGVFWLFDTDATNDNWHAAGVKADVDTAIANSAIAPVAATYDRLRIEVDTSGNAVAKILDDAQPHVVRYQTYLANAVTAGTLLAPYIAVQARAATASRDLDVDYVRVRQLGR